MQHRPFLSISLDIIRLIIDSIDDPRDLFRLALTSKTLYHFITSNDLYFRWLQCRWNHLNVWSLLEQDDRIASRVRLLELASSHILHGFIDTKHMPPLPPDLMAVDDPATQDESDIAAHFKVALINMVNLTKLSWRMLDPLDMPGNNVLSLCLDIALCHKNVRELDMHPFHVILLMNPTSSPQSRSPTTPMVHLTKICIIFNTDVMESAEINPDAPSVKKLVDAVVDCCPNLEDLSLKTDSTDTRMYPALRIFAEGRWPNLRRLDLYGGILCLSEHLDPDAKSAILHAFWKRHPNLECLLLRINQEHKLDIQSNVLPKLKSLSGFLNPMSSAVAVDVLSRIKHMCDYTGPGVPTPRFPISYFAHTTSLTSLIIMELDEGWEEILLNHPTITRFALGQPIMMYSSDLDRGHEYEQGLSKLKKLANMPSLTHLYVNDIRFRELSECVTYLSYFPKLKYMTGLDSQNWSVLKRDSEGKLIGLQKPDKALVASLDSVEEWGCDLHAAVNNVGLY